MSTFKALNIEYDDESEEEVDDTKEIKIEEALKLYQTALKLHAKAASARDETQKAYDTLLNYDVFKYPEALSEFRRHENLIQAATGQAEFYDQPESALLELVGNPESGSSTLPQLLHLSHKNQGQFILDALQDRIKDGAANERQGGATTTLEVRHDAVRALGAFVDALDKDESDAALWRRSAALGDVIGSYRVNRYCLESVVEPGTDEETPETATNDIQQSLAALELRKLLEKHDDDAVISDAYLSNIKVTQLAQLIKRREDKHWSQMAAYKTSLAPLSEHQSKSKTEYVLGPCKPDWLSVGAAIQELLADQQSLDSSARRATTVSIELIQSRPSDEKKRKEQLAKESEGQTQNSVQDQLQSALQQVDVSVYVTSNTSESRPAVESSEAKSSAIKTQEDPPQHDEGSELPGRKRSADSAGHAEPAEARGRSKRLRARESFAEQSSLNEANTSQAAKQHEAQLLYCKQADDSLSFTMNTLLGKLGCRGFGDTRRLWTWLQLPGGPTTATASNDSSAASLTRAIVDFQALLRRQKDESLRILTSAGNNLDDINGSTHSSGLATAARVNKKPSPRAELKEVPPSEGLEAFCDRLNSEHFSIEEAAWAWAMHFIAPKTSHNDPPTSSDLGSTYEYNHWSEAFKAILVKLLVSLDGYIMERALHQYLELGHRILNETSTQMLQSTLSECLSAAAVAQTLFELHLDVFILIRHPSSGVPVDTQVAQKYRVEKWSEISRDLLTIALHLSESQEVTGDMIIRHLWASVFHLETIDDMSQEHVIHCLENLKDLLTSSGSDVIRLPNNAVMPELSVDAVAAEISRLVTRDFFHKIFEGDAVEPAFVIENLEPLLESVGFQGRASCPAKEEEKHDDALIDEESEKDLSQELTNAGKSSQTGMSQELHKFLENADLMLVLSLWQRLRVAYDAIDYPTKVFSCYLRMIELLVGELSTEEFERNVESQRQFIIIRNMRLIDDALIRILALMRQPQQDLFECVDEQHLRSSIDALTQFFVLLHTANVFLDHVAAEPRSSGTLTVAVITKLQDIQMRAWKIQYLLFCEAESQIQPHGSDVNESRLKFLQVVHHYTGVRGFCKAANRLFLRLEKQELLEMSRSEATDTELTQVLFDLYGLKCCVSSSECQDHNCPPENLDRKQALSLLDFVLHKANRISIKDLPKSELRNAIEKIHGALAKAKPSENMHRNRSTYRNYIKSPINPLDLYGCLNGSGIATSMPVLEKNAPAASKGWFFLMGSLALKRFRSQKRVNAGPVEDIMLATAFFAQDLEYSLEQWETWFRLAQAFDSQIEESIVWSAEKLNGNHPDIVQAQRSAIHCYMQAVALSAHLPEDSPELSRKLADLYADFGTRIYTASREPFSMDAFSVADFERTYSGAELYSKPPFKPLTRYAAWRFASNLFRKAISHRPDKWFNYYMLSKCLWKMHTAPEDQVSGRQPSAKQVIAIITRSINELPNRRDNRQNPILEPHYRLVSIVDKLVRREVIDRETAEAALRASKYTSSSSSSDEEEDVSSWDERFFQILKTLRAADKANWHHRMVVRGAITTYKTTKDGTGAIKAQNELTQQTFTKTMGLQVWKPENERPGRHFVYTTQYVTFFSHLLFENNDLVSMELLAKRVRRKPHEFFNHAKLWSDMCTLYLKMLRQKSGVLEGHEDTIFKNLSQEDFLNQIPRLEAWCEAQTGEQHSRLLDALRDALELKKLNNNLMKPTTLDDLIGDTYASLYADVLPLLSELSPRTKGSPSAAQAQETAPNSEVVTPLIPAKPNMMSLGSLIHIDGPPEHLPRHPVVVPVVEPPGLSGSVNKPGEKEKDKEPKPRFRGVGRRDIKAAAETMVSITRPPSLTTTSSGAALKSSATPATPVARRGSKERRESRRFSARISVHDNDDHGEEEGNHEKAQTAGGPENDEVLLDDDDEESELSELEPEDVDEQDQEQDDEADDENEDEAADDDAADQDDEGDVDMDFPASQESEEKAGRETSMDIEGRPDHGPEPSDQLKSMFPGLAAAAARSQTTPLQDNASDASESKSAVSPIQNEAHAGKNGAVKQEEGEQS